MSKNVRSGKIRGDLVELIAKRQIKPGIPQFKTGDVVKVFAKIIEGTKERVQVFQGVVISRRRRSSADATFTVRKISYDVGVERTFPLYSPRIEKIEVLTHGHVKRGKLFYLRGLRGKASRIKSDTATNNPATKGETTSQNSLTEGDKSKADQSKADQSNSVILDEHSSRADSPSATA
jgi:large subunit ribosomal protein L19